MSIPTYDCFIEPLLRVLGEAPEGLTAKDARSQVAETTSLSVDDLRERLPSGRQTVFYNRVFWAHDRLKRANLSVSARRGFWKLTPEGMAYLTRFKTTQIPGDEIQRLAKVAAESTAKYEIDNTLQRASISREAVDSTKYSPIERLENALKELNESLEDDLMSNIMGASPTFFEQLVLDLLQAMGYGGSRESIQRTGGSGDGGIDGIINLDHLGIEKIYVQAKRWTNPVSRPDVQQFAGALSAQHATKGVFITTSRFTQGAMEDVEKRAANIALIDGSQLTKLMVEFGVGTSVERLVKLKQLDSNYFEDF